MEEPISAFDDGAAAYLRLVDSGVVNRSGGLGQRPVGPVGRTVGEVDQAQSPDDPLHGGAVQLRSTVGRRVDRDVPALHAVDVQTGDPVALAVATGAAEQGPVRLQSLVLPH